MDFTELINSFEIFFGTEYIKQVNKSKVALFVDWDILDEFNPELVDCLIHKPNDVFLAAQEALTNLDKKLIFRLTNIPTDRIVRIRDIRSENIGKLTCIKGVIKQASDVRPEIIFANFECNACANTVTILQDKATLIYPNKCECGSKSFTIKGKTLIDIQRIKLEEDLSNLEGKQAQTINVLLKNDLVDRTFQKKIIPGNVVVITGVLKDISVKEQDKETKKREYIIECNNIDTITSDFDDVEINEEDEIEIKRIAEEEDVLTYISSAIAPSIYGYKTIKQALLLQLVSGIQKTRPDGIVTRGDIHILLIGDPGSGKSQMVKFITNIAPKGIYVSGKAASGVGLSAAVVKDEFTGGWALEAGSLVLANGGLLSIDEFDKMSDNDRSAMHEAMEQQCITISKATIHATLSCKTIILAAANPKFGRFDSTLSITEQLNLPDTLISRFDLIFPIKDIPNKENDMLISGHILNATTEVTLSNDLIRKYIAYSRRFKPRLTPAAIKRIQEFYVGIRNRQSELVTLTARQLEALVRLSEASAKLRLSNNVLVKDADKAIELLESCLDEIATDPNTGQLSIDKMYGLDPNKKHKHVDIIHIINKIAINGLALESEVIEKAIEIDLFENEQQAEQFINKLKNEGELFAPKNGYIKLIK